MALIKDHPISIDLLHLILRYDPETGLIYWKHRPAHLFEVPKLATIWNKRFAGKEAFRPKDKDGYGVGSIYGKQYKAHRVAWALHYGEWPTFLLDHDNRNGGDNRIVNLKKSSHKENCRNITLPKNNTSGTIGVRWNKRMKRWTARIGVDSKHLFLGSFSTKEKAIKTRKEAEAKFGYHQNHGSIAIARPLA